MDKILFKHTLSDSWMSPINIITIIDKDKDNVVINDNIYTIPVKDIDNIKLLLSNKDLYLDKEILRAPILDGTIHNIKLLDKKEINCTNLWYWKEDINDTYTKNIINLINSIQKILYKNNINFNILDDED